MELMILIPVILLMGAVAIYMAASDHAMPALAATPVFASATPSERTGNAIRPFVGRKVSHRDNARLMDLSTRETPSFDHQIANLPATKSAIERFSQTDVLLADALTEMIGLKAEIYRLRNRVESLNQQVAILSGDNSTPPASPAGKRPLQLKKAA